LLKLMQPSTTIAAAITMGGRGCRIDHADMLKAMSTTRDSSYGPARRLQFDGHLVIPITIVSVNGGIRILRRFAVISLAREHIGGECAPARGHQTALGVPTAPRSAELTLFMSGSIWAWLSISEGGLTFGMKEASMKQFWLVAAAALILVASLPDGAFAQRGGFRGGGLGGGGFRGGAIGGGFRGGAIGGGFRGGAIGGGFRGGGLGIARVAPGFRGGVIGRGFRGGGLGIAGVGPRFRGAAIGRGFRVAGFRGAGWRRGWGWGWPVALGLGLGAWSYPYYSSYYSDPCIQWDGYQWVNICYSYY
jgi:hypothetical protein